MNTLVFGGTGKVGSVAVRHLAEKGFQVKVFSHSPEKLVSLPNNVQSVIGDLDQKQTILSAMDAIDTIILILGVHPSEEERGLAIIDAAKKANVKRIVSLSLVHSPGTEHVAFYRSKLAIEGAFKNSDMHWSIIRSSSFFQSDALLKNDIVDKGIFSAPIGSLGVNRIDTRDVGYAMAEAVIMPSSESQEFRIFGPEPLTGDSIASIYTHLLGREIRYGGDDLEEWAEFKKDGFVPWSLTALRTMYGCVQKNGMKPEPGETKSHLLPDKMITFETFASELTNSWNSSTGNKKVTV